MSASAFDLPGCLTSTRSTFSLAHTTVPTNSMQAAPSLSLQGGSESIHYVLPKREYRQEIFQVFEESFIKRFELNVEPQLRDRGSKPYWHCLTVMKAIRLMLRLNLDPIDGGLRWSAGAGRFTEDDTAMVRHTELLAVCHKFKPSFTINQLHRALTVLKDYGLIWSCPGRPKATSRYAKLPGTVMYLRVNTGRMLKALEGGLTLAPVRLSSCQVLDAPIGATVLPAREMGSGELVAPQVAAQENQPGNDQSNFQVEWMLKVAPAVSPLLSEAEVTLSEDEKHMVGFLTSTAGLFQETDTWSHDCSRQNELNTAQMARLRLHMRTSGLTLAFIRDYADVIVNSSASSSPDGKAPWWASCSIDFFLGAFRRIRQEVRARRLEQVRHYQAHQNISRPALDQDFQLNAMLYLGFDPAQPGQDLTVLSRGLGHNPNTPLAQDPEQRRIWAEQDAYKGIVAVLLADQLPAETLRSITSQTRHQVIGWLRRNPLQAKRFERVRNFRFWFGLSDEIMQPISLAAAHSTSALQAGHSYSQCLALAAATPATTKASSAPSVARSTTAAEPAE